jgi:antitoxin component YwqK of YwqJK toxin-antitoxin module
MRQFFKYKLGWFFLLTVLLSSCAKEKYIGSLVDFPGEKEGLIEAYTEDGKLYETGKFKNGVLNGNRKIYYPSGQLQILETYVAGVFEGPYVKFYENGKKKVEGVYANSSMEGIWKTYYEDGSLKDEVTMHDNMENGPFKEYYQNGNQKAIGTYKDGESEHGPLQLFDESGTLVKKMACDHGICRTTWKYEATE